MKVCPFVAAQARDACVHLHVVDVRHRVTIFAPGIGSGAEVEAAVASTISAVLVAVLVAADEPGW